MNPRKNPVVTRGPWSFSSTTGTGIRGAVLSVAAHRRMPDRPGLKFLLQRVLLQRGQLDKHTVDLADFDARNAEINRLGLVYGYLQYRGRNTTKFVMSRAARRRGYTTADRRYNQDAATWAAREGKK